MVGLFPMTTFQSWKSVPVEKLIEVWIWEISRNILYQCPYLDTMMSDHVYLLDNFSDESLLRNPGFCAACLFPGHYPTYHCAALLLMTISATPLPLVGCKTWARKGWRSPEQDKHPQSCSYPLRLFFCLATSQSKLLRWGKKQSQPYASDQPFPNTWGSLFDSEDVPSVPAPAFV